MAFCNEKPESIKYEYRPRRHLKDERESVSVFLTSDVTISSGNFVAKRFFFFLRPNHNESQKSWRLTWKLSYLDVIFTTSQRWKNNVLIWKVSGKVKSKNTSRLFAFSTLRTKMMHIERGYEIFFSKILGRGSMM